MGEDDKITPPHAKLLAGITKDVKNLCKSCKEGQVMKPEGKHNEAPIQPNGYPIKTVRKNSYGHCWSTQSCFG